MALSRISSHHAVTVDQKRAPARQYAVLHSLKASIFSASVLASLGGNRTKRKAIAEVRGVRGLKLDAMALYLMAFPRHYN